MHRVPRLRVSAARRTIILHETTPKKILAGVWLFAGVNGHATKEVIYCRDLDADYTHFRFFSDIDFVDALAYLSKKGYYCKLL